MGYVSSWDRAMGLLAAAVLTALLAAMVFTTGAAAAASRQTTRSTSAAARHQPSSLGQRSGSLRFRGAKKASQSGNLIDMGGQITPTSHTYAIFWGPSSAWTSDVVPGIGSLFSGFNGSNYFNLAGQYMRGATLSTAYEGPRTDSSAPPKKVTPATLGAEVQRVYGPNLDPAGIYFVYTSNMPSGGGFCAWHSFTTVNGQNVAVAYMPNTTGISGCDPGNSYNLSGSEGLRSLANVTAHEFMESVTDTWPASGSYGWIDSSKSEIGDKCAWQFSGPVTLSNKTTWQLQEEWSNAIFGCAQGS